MHPDRFLSEFFAWERPGRGYDLWPHPISLEPRYRPFGRATATSQPLDDGRRPNFWQKLRGEKRAASVAPTARPNDGDPYRYEPREEQQELQLVLPDAFVVRPSFAEQLVASFWQLQGPFSFELIGLAEGIVVQMTAQPRDLTVVRQNLSAYFPEARIKQKERFLRGLWQSQDRFGTLIDFGLSEAFFQPLESGLRVDLDPLVGVVAALNELEADELGLVQVLFQPALQPWEADLLDALSLAGDISQALPLGRRKIAEPLFATVIRVVGMGADSTRAFDLARNIGKAMIAASRSEFNQLMPLDDQGYDLDAHAEDILKRQSRRSGMLLNLSELLCLAHPPSASVRSDRLRRISSKSKTAPAIVRGNELILGINEHDDEKVEVSLSDEQRLRHVYVIGGSGTGKSKLLLNMIMQDMEAFRGLAVLDPHGDLIDEVLARVPNERTEDVILFDPADRDFPVGFNILAARSEAEKTLLASDLVAVFQRLATSWGDQMTSILGNAILAFLESSQGGTLLDLRRFLIEDAFRNRFLPTV